MMKTPNQARIILQDIKTNLSNAIDEIGQWIQPTPNPSVGGEF